MYEDALVEIGSGDPRAIVARLRSCDRELRLLEARKLALAAEFADCYGYAPDTFAPGGETLRETYPGCPAVAEFAPFELGAALGIPEERAWELIEDAVGIRHRLPQVWAAMNAGDVWSWQARRIVVRTGLLSLDDCHAIDRDVTLALPRMPITRVLRLVDGRVAQLSPATEEPTRFVKVSTPDASAGEVWAKLNPVDARRLDRTVSELAGVLKQGGDERDLDARRAAALGVLSSPARAFQLQAATLLDLDPREGNYDELDGPTDKVGACADAAHPADGARAQNRSGSRGPLPEAATPAGEGTSLTGWARLAGAVGAIDPERLRPQSELHIHLTAETLAAWAGGPAEGAACGISRCDGATDASGAGAAPRGAARCEELGAVLRHQLVHLLGHDRVVVRPVVIPLDLEPQDSYEARPVLRRALSTVYPHETFPFGMARSRRCDLDHAVPYDSSGPPGQTGPDNLQPLSRRAHRAKTHGGWRVSPDEDNPIGWIWTSPLGYVYAVGPDGATLLEEPAPRGWPVAA